MKRTAVIAYLVALHAALLVAFMRPDAILWHKQVMGFEPKGWQHIQAIRAFQLLGDSLVPDGAAIFLGDSLTEGLPVSSIAPYAVNYGIGYQTSEQLLDSIKLYGSLGRAGVIYLNIGTNDVRDGIGDALPRQYAKVLAALPSDVPLVWSSIMPRRPEDADTIRAANDAAEALCVARPGCAFVDTWAIFAPNGNRDETLYRDAVHPNAAGYAKWISVLSH